MAESRQFGILVESIRDAVNRMRYNGKKILSGGIMEVSVKWQRINWIIRNWRRQRRSL